jgi:hypothetical protein
MRIEEELNTFWNSEFYSQLGGFTYFDESKKGILMKDLRMTNFQSLYPTLLIDLHVRGYKVEEIDDKYQRIIDLLSKSKSELSIDERVELNSFYVRIYKFSEIGKKLSYMVSFYGRLIMQELLELNKKNIIYMDTDRIIHQNDLDFGDIRFKIIEANIEYLKIVKIKKMVYLSENKIHSRGYIKNNSRDDQEQNSIISEIKSQKRSDRIDGLEIF